LKQLVDVFISETKSRYHDPLVGAQRIVKLRVETQENGAVVQLLGRVHHQWVRDFPA